MASTLITSAPGINRSIAESRQSLFDLQRQLATGKAVKTYGALGQDRSTNLSLRGELKQIEGYESTISQVNVRLDVLQQSLGRLRDVVSETRSETFVNAFEISSGGQTLYQLTTAGRFDQVIALLNTRVGDRYLAGGREIEKPPVLTPDEILNGSGAKAGFKQVAEERRLADLGADGRGRLVLPAPGGAAVSLAEDAAGHPFGFKLDAVASNLTGATVTGPAGAPSTIGVTFSATLPRDGDRIEITLDLPDGTQDQIKLVARGGAAGDGEFQIGADETATAANFQVALDSAIQSAAQRSLSAASAFAAADDFFDFGAATPPQRVAGPPFETATTLVDATAANTVFWYQGEVSITPARQSAIAKADDSVLVPYGARANEQAFVTVMKSMAVLSAETFSAGDPSAADRYEEIRDRAGAALGFPAGTQTIDSIVTELTVATTTLGAAKQRHDANTILLQGFVEESENADAYEISAQILSLQNRIEASLQVTASLSRLSLVNFL